jgi:hypothetical protein
MADGEGAAQFGRTASGIQSHERLAYAQAIEISELASVAGCFQIDSELFEQDVNKHGDESRPLFKRRQPGSCPS